jgi:hypothetical protein
VTFHRRLADVEELELEIELEAASGDVDEQRGVEAQELDPGRQQDVGDRELRRRVGAESLVIGGAREHRPLGTRVERDRNRQVVEHLAGGHVRFAGVLVGRAGGNRRGEIPDEAVFRARQQQLVEQLQRLGKLDQHGDPRRRRLARLDDREHVHDV